MRPSIQHIEACEEKTNFFFDSEFRPMHLPVLGYARRLKVTRIWIFPVGDEGDSRHQCVISVLASRLPADGWEAGDKYGNVEKDE